MRTYSKDLLFSQLDSLKVERTGSQVVTYYNNRVLKVSNVSNRYEVFDVSKFLKDKIELIEKSFDIKKYAVSIRGGVQYITLVSDTITVDGLEYEKTFFLLNSTDRSKRFHFSLGLYSKKDNMYFIGINNVSLGKKHYVGLNSAVNAESEKIDAESFVEQVKSISNLMGHRVLYSKLRESILVNDKGEIPLCNHKKMDNLNTKLRLTNQFTPEQKKIMYKTSRFFGRLDPKDDFYVDAYTAFVSYMKTFAYNDSHLIQVETARIFKITQYMIRKEKISKILC